ncbi:acetyl-CoA carboxylase biotin carboxyl carrier protein subunit [Corynebacterium sp. sy017]|uniref:acetyl-CoA carboxylase biotin carboxyl carrier protein subunit n=1 Tax=unclassified Corynebacterium TaxID=2624378 RepID=UPI0011870D4E|nr:MULTISPECIES: biotin/lipoyl-containing protein [unclassified Corynebacterium]MBP3089161.1 acetyl-CoA carboxylase biotin carboxyl carrier protein subunit [Corynebacterium sp. sy017]QDZ42514.1 acetyl-CoA carboxylase biotin carboxyl carrier protein subunit [Corynebacterium sp. sy039]TSD91473.1 acetyl-CoA carboxylase biotin carboxyl carrier protein subunit [Corynebacterium sp. SY003]
MNICAPFAGIVHYKVRLGDQVKTGQELASVEALKLESSILAPGPGVVTQLGYDDFDDVVGGATLMTLAQLGT